MWFLSLIIATHTQNTLLMKNSILLFTFLFISTFTFAEISQISYKIEHNDLTNHYDCKMYIESGFAVSTFDRFHNTAQFSIIVKTGTFVALEESFLPLLDNADYMGTVPKIWSIDNIIVSPAEFQGYDIISIVAGVGGNAYYNNLNTGDEITLFSLSAEDPEICSLSLRILEHDVDPTIIIGDDFSNSMKIGDMGEDYIGNLLSDNIWLDVDISLTEGSVCPGECITLEPTFICIFPGLTYEWSTGETTEAITICPDFSDEYILFLSGPNGFSGETTTYISVNPQINTFGFTDLCVGFPVDYTPNSGTWSSSNTSVATVSNAGVVTPISSGTATITNTSSTGTCSDEVTITVTDPEPAMITGKNNICVGDETQLSPSTGVSWISGNNATATVDDLGVVTGEGLGQTVFTYITDIGQCESDPSPILTVSQIPEPWITGADTICIEGTTTMIPSTGVIWESSDPSVATIDNDGNVTGVSAGSTTFYFTDMATECTSDESEPVTIRPLPIVELATDTLCQGQLLDCSVNVTGGTWIVTVIAGDPMAATIDNSGTIQTSEPGIVSVQYISEEGCISSDQVLFTIVPVPSPEITSNSPICIGENLLLSATPSAGANYTYQWTGPNGFTSNERNVTIPNASMDDTGLYTLIAREHGCISEPVNIDVFVEDCDPCDDIAATEEWIKVPASLVNFPSIGDYEIGGSFVTGRELDDFVYYNTAQQEIRLIQNTGNGSFEDELVLFNLPYISSIVEIDIVDIDQDGLSDIVIYQPAVQTGPNEDLEVTVTIYRNLDNFLFGNNLSIVEDSGSGFFYSKRVYKDLDNKGFLDIIPYQGSIHFTDNWESESVVLEDFFYALIIDDLNEDGLIDLLGNYSQLYTNDGNRNFSFSTINSDLDVGLGLYDSETGVFTDGDIATQINKGSTPSSMICAYPNTIDIISTFYANINSSSSENGVLTSLEGFYVFDSPLTCDNSTQYETILSFIPHSDGKIDLTKNGYSDFITVEDGNIFAWINPKEQPKLRGTAFIDNNGDGIYNENDSPLRNVLISIEPGNLSVLTDDDGNYQFTVPEGSYTLTANVNEGEWVIDELTIENVEIADPCNLGYDFGFVPDPTALPMVNLSMVNTIARCDFEVRFTITVENTGTEPLESQLQFEFDDKTTLFAVEFSGSSTVGNKVIADIGPLTPFQPQQYKIKVKMPGGSSVLPTLDFKAILLDEFGEFITEYGYTEQLRCSYDPNDKREFPDRIGDDNLTLMDEDLEYTIRFQNNGNDTAYNVKIVDPLDVNIDPSSIRVVSSSHDVETCIEGTDLIFLFENIYLVDSTTDYPSSQGFVTFKCNARTGRAEFTEVNNTADIFFDTNLPIKTNQTLNTLVSELCTNKTTVIDKYICEGDEYLGYSETGSYYRSFDLTYGCDSLVTINLTVQGITYSQQAIDVCGEMAVTIGSNDYFIDSDITIVDTMMTNEGCISNILKYEFTVIPDLILVEEMKLCVDGIEPLPENMNGSWSVDDESIVTLDNQEGTITTVNSGIAILQYVDDETGCTDIIQVEVFAEPIIINEGNDEICINETNKLTSDSDGTWLSSDPDIASITNDGLVLAKKAGSVTLTFSSEESGCHSTTEIIILETSDSKCLVATEELSNESVNLYPNPATESIFIESHQVWNAIRLINAQGQVVNSNMGGYRIKKEVDLTGMLSGLYFMVIEKENEVVVKRFVVD